ASTPTRAITFLGGKFFSRWFMGLIQMLILVGFGIFILRVDWGESAATVFLFLASFAFSGTALGLMLGTLAQTPNQAGNLTTIISMMTAALGGAWWPLEITPLTFQHIVKILPTTWAMIGFNNIIIKRQTLSGVWDEMLILIGFGLAFLLVAWFNLNRVNGKRSVRTKTLNGE
ncbi:MAG: ABC transporter permease, partial [Anaerolineaceae bacterium]|nr:ABC transporter permease [Anaerolineaceae bacterium]